MSLAKQRTAVAISRQRGVTLIEALVAAVILAIGIVGIVSLLTISKVSQYESTQRTRAVSLADDMLERIRRNPQGLATYDDWGLGSPLGDGATSAPPTDCSAAACSAADMAAFDLREWELLLDGASTTVEVDGNDENTAGLTNIQGCIVFNPTPDPVTGLDREATGTVDIVLEWQGLGETLDATEDGTLCGDDGDEDLTRRQIIVSSYIIDETEL